MTDNPFLTKKNETITGVGTVHKDLWHIAEIASLFLGWLVLPFIPLLLSAPFPFLFYTILFLYVVFFIYINHFKMHYHWTETIIFICLFLFFVFAMKSLIDYHVVDEKDVIRTAVRYGTLE